MSHCVNLTPQPAWLGEKRWRAGTDGWVAVSSWEVTDTHTRPARVHITCFGSAVSFSCPSCSPHELRHYSWNIKTCVHVPCHQGRHPDCPHRLTQAINYGVLKGGIFPRLLPFLCACPQLRKQPGSGNAAQG